MKESIWLRRLGALGVATGAGFLCAWLHTPLPWMIGPLFAVAIARLSGVPLEALPAGRYMGQWIIGTALGLYFTPVVVRQVAQLAPWMVCAAVFALLVGFSSGMVLSWLSGADRRTGFFASVPGGATEMSLLAERFGARVDLVAVAQSIRIVIVVSVIPFVFTWLDVHGADPYQQGTKVFSWTGLAELLALTSLGGAALHRFNFPNGWVIGALCVSLPLTALQVEFSSVPTWLSNVGQLLIGCALASRFQRDFLARAPRYLVSVIGSVLFAILLSLALSALLAWAMAVHPATMALATAPGGIAEMAITAKVLQLGVPVVTAFHVTRMVLLVTTTGIMYELAVGWHAKRRGTGSPGKEDK